MSKTLKRRLSEILALSALVLTVAGTTAFAASRDFAGNVDNNAGVWHTNSCNGGSCVSLGGSIPCALYNNIQVGTNRTLFVRVLFGNGTTSGGTSWPSSVSSGTKNLATNVLATSAFRVQGMTNSGIPNFQDTLFRCTQSQTSSKPVEIATNCGVVPGARGQ